MLNILENTRIFSLVVRTSCYKQWAPGIPSFCCPSDLADLLLFELNRHRVSSYWGDRFLLLSLNEVRDVKSVLRSMIFRTKNAKALLHISFEWARNFGRQCRLIMKFKLEIWSKIGQCGRDKLCIRKKSFSLQLLSRLIQFYQGSC